MMGTNLVGKRFGYLTVTKLNNKDARGASWVCKCDCGKEIILCTTHLMGSKNRRPNKSCGCMKKKLGGKSMKYPRIHRIWQHMIYRCYRPEETGYERYGGKGITVCKEWLNSFRSFLDWALSNGYSEELTIDRVDSTKPYSPDNCRWVDYYIQGQNRGPQKRNKLGILGVCPHGDGYRAHIQRYGKRKHLGVFKTIEEAIVVREKAEEKFKRTGTL